MFSNRDSLERRTPQKRPMKITTRITLSNVVFFSIVIALIILFVYFLTQEFLFLKNRDELYVKRDQIESYFDTQESTLSTTPAGDRLKLIYEDLQELYLFDHYKYIAFIYNTEDESSYAFEKTYYDKLFLSNFDIVTNDLTFTYAIEDRSDKSWMTFHINEPNDDGTVNQVATAYIPLPMDDTEDVINQISFLGENILETTLRVSYDDDNPIYLTLFLFPQYDRAFIIILLSALIVSSLIGILLISFFGRYITKRALTPLVNLAQRAEKIDLVNLREHIPETGANDEIDSLIRSLNAMLVNLEHAFENQRRFISDASHELRIPLTVMIGYSELLQKNADSDPELLQESIQAIDHEARSMKYLVEKLLLLARVDSNRIPVSLSEILICQLFDQIRQDSEHLYDNLKIHIECAGELRVYADYNLLLQSFRALIDNAAKYSQSEQGLVLKAVETDQKIILSVKDFGIGIPKDALHHITERFYRVSADRSRDSGGFGLGLAIVKSLIANQNGHLEIRSELNVGTEVLISFHKK